MRKVSNFKAKTTRLTLVFMYMLKGDLKVIFAILQSHSQTYLAQGLNSSMDKVMCM